MASTVQRLAGDTVELGVHLTKDGSGVTGQTPTVELRRPRDGRYFNWAATVAPYWVTTGGLREFVLPEKSWLPGFYSRKWDQKLYDGGVKEDYVAIYRNTDPEYPVEEMENLQFNFLDLILVRKLLSNETVLRKITDWHWEQETKDDDGSVLRTDDITVVGSEERRRPT